MEALWESIQEFVLHYLESLIESLPNQDKYLFGT